MEIYFLLLLLAMVPLTYADCPEGTCCPAGDNCEVSNRLCKPNSARDCRGGNEPGIISWETVTYSIPAWVSLERAWNHFRISFT